MGTTTFKGPRQPYVLTNFNTKTIIASFKGGFVYRFGPVGSLPPSPYDGQPLYGTYSENEQGDILWQLSEDLREVLQ